MQTSLENSKWNLKCNSHAALTHLKPHLLCSIITISEGICSIHGTDTADMCLLTCNFPFVIPCGQRALNHHCLYTYQMLICANRSSSAAFQTEVLLQVPVMQPYCRLKKQLYFWVMLSGEGHVIHHYTRPTARLTLTCLKSCFHLPGLCKCEMEWTPGKIPVRTSHQLPYFTILSNDTFHH